MDIRSIQFLILFVWVAICSTTDWQELDGVSSSGVRPHFVQLHDPTETETEANFPLHYQQSGEVNYLIRFVEDRESSDGNSQDSTTFQPGAQTRTHTNQKTTFRTTISSEENESEEFSEEETEKPLATALLGTNVRFTISAEDERYTRTRHEESGEAETAKKIDNTAMPEKSNVGIKILTSTSKSITHLTSSVILNNTRIPFVSSINDQTSPQTEENVITLTSSTTTFTSMATSTTPPTTSQSPTITTFPLSPISLDKTTNLTTPPTSTTPVLVTSFQSTSPQTHYSKVQYLNMKSQSLSSPNPILTQSLSPSIAMETTSTKPEPTTPHLPSTEFKTIAHRPTIRSRLVRPKMIRLSSQTKTTTKQSNVIPITNSQKETFTTRSTTSEETNPHSTQKQKTDISVTPITTLTQTEASPVMTLLKDLSFDYPQDMPPDIETYLENEDNRQSPSPTMSASTTNTIVISSIMGGCAILFFALLMIFYMWKQRRVRRRRKRPLTEMSLTKPNFNWQFGQMYENE